MVDLICYSFRCGLVVVIALLLLPFSAPAEFTCDDYPVPDTVDTSGGVRQLPALLLECHYECDKEKTHRQQGTAVVLDETVSVYVSAEAMEGGVSLFSYNSKLDAISGPGADDYINVTITHPDDSTETLKVDSTREPVEVGHLLEEGVNKIRLELVDRNGGSCWANRTLILGYTDDLLGEWTIYAGVPNQLESRGPVVPRARKKTVEGAMRTGRA